MSSELAGVRKLFAFSERLINRRSVDDLLVAMLDDVIELTHADKGFLLLLDGAETGAAASDTGRRLSVRASRNVRREAITKPDGNISDSIVRQVIAEARPVIVSDALADTHFGQSESVIAMKLSSVMCAPLLSQGEVIGALYVGNDRVKHLFDRTQLELLSIFASQASLILQNAMLLSALRADKEKLVAELHDKKFGEIIGACPSMLEVFRKLQKVAGTDISVLITGETGTGKELIAKELHRRSPRASGPFITINCGAIPENLIESELFGHVKGAFTGAVMSRPGKFQIADKGTLFLDEIGELPLNLQVKLLRALQERVVVRVGDSKPEKVDIRVVAATNRNLEEEIRANNFREDLYYRLNVVNLWMPPLRDRGDDVMIIAKVLLSKYADELGSKVKGMSPAALAAVKKYSWPGNIRQLENRIKKALVLCDQTLLSPDDLDLGAAAETAILPWRRPRKTSSAATCSKCWSATTATAPRRRATWASIRGRSSGTWRRKRTRCRARRARAAKEAGERVSDHLLASRSLDGLDPRPCLHVDLEREDHDDPVVRRPIARVPEEHDRRHHHAQHVQREQHPPRPPPLEREQERDRGRPTEGEVVREAGQIHRPSVARAAHVGPDGVVGPEEDHVGDGVAELPRVAGPRHARPGEGEARFGVPHVALDGEALAEGRVEGDEGPLPAALVVQEGAEGRRAEEGAPIGGDGVEAGVVAAAEDEVHRAVGGDQAEVPGVEVEPVRGEAVDEEERAGGEGDEAPGGAVPGAAAEDEVDREEDGRHQDLRAHGGAEGEPEAEQIGVGGPPPVGEAEAVERRRRHAEGEGDPAERVPPQADPRVVDDEHGPEEEARPAAREEARRGGLGVGDGQRAQHGEAGVDRRVAPPAGDPAQRADEGVGAVGEEGERGVGLPGLFDHPGAAVEVAAHVGEGEAAGGRRGSTRGAPPAPPA